MSLKWFLVLYFLRKELLSLTYISNEQNLKIKMNINNKRYNINITLKINERIR